MHFIKLFTVGCAGFSLQCRGFLDLRCLGAALQLSCVGFSCCGAQTVPCAGSRVAARGLQIAGSVVAHRLSCPVTCGILPGEGLNPFRLHWQEDSLAWDH